MPHITEVSRKGAADGRRPRDRPERLSELDALRAGALVAVVLIHAGAWVTPAAAPAGRGAMAAIIVLARFCVPAFVFASGFALYHSHGARPEGARVFLRRRWTRVLLPWAACVPLFLGVDAAAGGLPLNAGSVAEWLAYGPGHLYFLLLIAQLYLVFLALRWVTLGGRKDGGRHQELRLGPGDGVEQAVALGAEAERHRELRPRPGDGASLPGAPSIEKGETASALPEGFGRLAIFTAVAVVAQVGLSAWHSHGPAAQGWLALPANNLAYELGPFWVGTFSLGCLTAALWPRLARLHALWPLAAAVSVGLGVLVLAEGGALPPQDWREGNGAYLWVSRLPQTVVWCLTLLWIARHFAIDHLPLWPGVKALSRHSLGIYLLHPLALTLLGPRTAALPSALRVPLLMAAALTLGWAAVAAIVHTRPGAVALGETPAARASFPPRRLTPAPS